MPTLRRCTDGLLISQAYRHSSPQSDAGAIIPTVTVVAGYNSIPALKEALSNIDWVLEMPKISLVFLVPLSGESYL